MKMKMKMNKRNLLVKRKSHKHGYAARMYKSNSFTVGFNPSVTQTGGTLRLDK